jgi:cell division protein ZipA
MELSVREWTIIVGVLLILAVFLDGYRRVRNERSNRIRVSLSKQVFQQHSEPEEPVDTVNPELPNGGARVIAKQRSQSLHLTESVPVLIEPVRIPEIPPQQSVPTAAAAPPVEDIDPEPIAASAVESADLFEVEPQRDGRVEPQFEEEPRVESARAPAREEKASGRLRRNKHQAAEQSYIDEMVDEGALNPPPEPQEVLVVNVISKDKGGFHGPDLLQILLACDLRFGKMHIFHRYENAHGRGPIQFSLANLVEPGTFDLDSIDTLTTPGVSFFMTLPGPQQSITAFNYMIETAQVLVRNLNAEMRDDAHSVMTAQTIEHCRQRIRDFERKQLTLQL